MKMKVGDSLSTFSCVPTFDLVIRTTMATREPQQIHNENISKSERRFLENYRPKSNIFTSAEEMQTIRKKLGLEQLSEEQLEKKNENVARLYSELMDRELIRDAQGNIIGRTEKREDYRQGSLSVTAVISNEYYIRRRRTR